MICPACKEGELVQLASDNEDVAYCWTCDTIQHDTVVRDKCPVVFGTTEKCIKGCEFIATEYCTHGGKK